MSYLFFFGHEAVPGTAAKTIPPDGTVLHISQATLAAGAKDGEVYRVYVEVEDVDNEGEDDEQKPKKFLVTTLVGQKQETQHLDLNFAGEQVTFTVEGGDKAVHLVGYYNVLDMEDDDDEVDDEATAELLRQYAEEEGEDADFEPSEDELNNSKDYYMESDSDEANGVEEEIPKKETPKKETPKKQTPKKEAPKKETPKKEKGGQKRKLEESATPSPGKQQPKKQKTQTPNKQNAKQQNSAKSPAKSPSGEGKKNNNNRKNKNKNKK